MSQKLLDARDYQLINQLSLKIRRKVAGMAAGEQRSLHQGGGIEFVDYRDYQSGDDIRQIDWTVFLRLRRLLVKLCAEEKELTLIILLDNSCSMRFGNPDKLWIAQKMAIILAGIALHGGNRAGIATLESNLNERVKPARNQISLTGILKSLESLEPVERIDLINSIRQFVSRYRRKCMFVVLTDLLFPEWPQFLKNLGSSENDGYIIQLLSPEEQNPPYLGEVTLSDMETQVEIPLHIGADLIRNYRKELAKYLAEVRQNCHRLGLGHTLVNTDSQLAKVFSDDLRKGGLLC